MGAVNIIRNNQNELDAGDTKGKGMAIAGTVVGAIDLVAVLWFVNIIQVY